MAWWFGAAAEVVGKIGSKLVEWIPSKRESLRSRIDKTKREMDDLQKQKPWNFALAKRYAILASRLRKLESAASNS